jgi:hypothetical protein
LALRDITRTVDAELVGLAADAPPSPDFGAGAAALPLPGALVLELDELDASAGAEAPAMRLANRSRNRSMMSGGATAPAAGSASGTASGLAALPGEAVAVLAALGLLPVVLLAFEWDLGAFVPSDEVSAAQARTLGRMISADPSTQTSHLFTPGGEWPCPLPPGSP